MAIFRNDRLAIICWSWVGCRIISSVSWIELGSMEIGEGSIQHVLWCVNIFLLCFSCCKRLEGGWWVPHSKLASPSELSRERDRAQTDVKDQPIARHSSCQWWSARRPSRALFGWALCVIECRAVKSHISDAWSFAYVYAQRKRCIWQELFVGSDHYGNSYIE